VNEFWRTLARGTLVAAKAYGGEDFACVLGQEMAGYATGEVYFVSQAYGMRHSHLDAGGYSYDQKCTDKNAAEAVGYLLEDERGRVLITCMVACLFSRQVYTRDRLAQALTVVGYPELATDLDGLAGQVQRERWRIKFKSGYDPARIKIPKRYLEVETWKGKIDPVYLDELGRAYQAAIRGMAGVDAGSGAAGEPGAA
jgi:aldehyde:ferredoxin oxidoreductase